MARHKDFHVLVASDGSLSGTAATVTATHFPWPAGTRADGVVARESGTNEEWLRMSDAFEQAARLTAEAAGRTLENRWADARVRVVEGPPAVAIVRASRRAGTDVIVMGWRGHGVMRRVLSGSVSRMVVRAAPCSVLVVRRALRDLHTIVVGVDGSAQSTRAVELAARFQPPKAARMVLVTAAPLMSDPSNPLLPIDIRKSAASGVANINKRRVAEARANLNQLAKRPRAAGWRVDVAVTNAAPLESLLSAVTDSRADLLVVGATGASQLRRLLLGSVAQGALDRSPVPVLVVR